MERSIELGNILGKLSKLGLDELRVVDKCVDGLLQGAKIYGEMKLSTDKRDMVKEALEEARDLAIYLSARLVQLEGK